MSADSVRFQESGRNSDLLFSVGTNVAIISNAFNDSFARLVDAMHSHYKI